MHFAVEQGDGTGNSFGIMGYLLGGRASCDLAKAINLKNRFSRDSLVWGEVNMAMGIHVLQYTMCLFGGFRQREAFVGKMGRIM